MVLPNLIHIAPITVQQIDRATTVYDPNSREPIQKAARSVSVTVPGQPRWTLSERQLEVHGFGPSDDIRGYVLFRFVDLASAGITIRINDRLIMQGHLVDEVYVTRLQPMAHYTDQNGASFIRAWFTDRLPAKER